MVFSSVPAYLYQSNWNPQHINHHHQIIGASSATNPLVAPPPPPPPQQPHGGPGSGSIRPGSMSERARMANIPMPESALKCPRCESTNTKFCYFNNYSLSQPRHFCKTCRRYWTRGGALRSVPVGGGCRRNKRSTKSATSSKCSPASSDNNNNNNSNSRQTNNNNPSTTTSNNNNTISNGYTGGLLNLTPPQFQQLRYISPLGQLSESFAGHTGLSSSYNGNIPEMGDHQNMGFNGAGNLLGFEQSKLQQFPFLGGLEPTPPGINYQFQAGGESGFVGGGELRPKISNSFLSSVKMEENNRNPDLRLMSWQLSGGMQENEHDQWNVNAANWTDQLSGFTSSSTSNHLK